MFSWLHAAPAFVIALLLVYIPGLAVATAAGVRGLRLIAIAAPISFSIAGIVAVVYAPLGLSFSTSTFALAVLALTLLTAAIRVGLRRRAPGARRSSVESPSRRRTTHVFAISATLGLTIAAVTIGALLLAGIESPSAIAQLFDNVFHLNAVAIIHATGAGSSLTLGNLTEASTSFYPAAFHDLTSLLLAFGVTTPVALNAMSIALSAVVWPISLLFLTTRLFGRRPEVAILTGTLAGAFAAYPYRPLSFGVLYPFHAGVAMMLVVVALIVELYSMQRTRPIPPAATVLTLIAVSPGVALTHPSILVAALAFASPFVAIRLVRDISSENRAMHRTRLLMSFTYLIASAAAFLVVRPPLTSAPWDPIQSYKEAIGAIATVSPGAGTAVAWGLFALALVGLAAAARRPRRLAGVTMLYVLAAVFYFASAAVPSAALRDLLSGVWYRDTERLSALFVVAAAPLVLGGALATCAAIRCVLGHGRTMSRVAARTTAIVLVGAFALLTTLRGPIPQAREWLNQSFGNQGVQNLLSDQERAMMPEVTRLVPVDGVILGDPRTGASLTPAFADRETVAPHIFGARSEAEQYLLDHWDEAGTNPAVCPIIRSLNAYWALDFGTLDVLGRTGFALPGTDRLAENAPGISRIAGSGDVALYEASACKPTQE